MMEKVLKSIAAMGQSLQNSGGDKGERLRVASGDGPRQPEQKPARKRGSAVAGVATPNDDLCYAASKWVKEQLQVKTEDGEPEVTDDAAAKLWMEWLETIPSVNGKTIHQALKDNGIEQRATSRKPKAKAKDTEPSLQQKRPAVAAATGAGVFHGRWLPGGLWHDVASFVRDVKETARSSWFVSINFCIPRTGMAWA